MEPVTHVIDPNADTIIILSNALVNFALWDKEEIKLPSKNTDNDPWSATESEWFIGTPKTLMKSKKGKKAMSRLETRSEDTPPVNGFTTSETSSLFGDYTTSSPNDPIAPFATDDKLDHSDTAEVHYRVSSRHLALASPWFKRALSKYGWSESGRNPEDGMFHVKAAYWDEEALLVVLNILHLRNGKVPRSVSLEMLAKIAVLVDYYECGEALEVFTEKWIESLKASTPVPSTYDRDLVLWIWVSWIFDLADHFERATAVVIKEGQETLRNLELPIPSKVSNDIDCKRYQAIESVISQLHDLLEKYRGVGYNCPLSKAISFECGSMMLGALTKELNRTSLLSPRPELPFTQLSFTSVCDLVRSIQSPNWTNHTNGGGYYSGSQGLHSCNLKSTVTRIVTNAAAAVYGLDLKKMKRHSF